MSSESAWARSVSSVAYEDERLTSWEAAERMGDPAADGPRRESGELDSEAARLILQQYLDGRRPPAGDKPIPDDQWPPEETE